MIKILLVGPLTPPIHGQSLAFTRFVESIDDKKKTVININLDDKSKMLKILYTFKTLLIIFYKTVFYKYDVIYFTCTRSFLGSIKDILLINIASLKKVRIINHLHGSDFDEFLNSSNKWYKKILYFSYKKVDISIVLLDDMKEQFKDFENMEIKVVPNFYDNELDHKIIEKDGKNINLVYLSNIMKSKGIFELINAFKILSQKYNNIYLNIAGGFIADEYMNIVKVEKIFYQLIEGNEKINYLGKVFGKEKVRLLQNSDIFILPTYYKSEAFPISILEAMACRNAIVTTNYKYLPNIVTKYNGNLVNPRSTNSLIIGIESLLVDALRLSEIQNYNSRNVKEKYSLKLYLDTLNKIVMKK